MKWYAGALMVLVVALFFGLGALAFAMYVLLAMLVVSRLLARHWIENLSALRECSRLTAQIGDRVAVIVEIHNRSRLPIPWVLLEDMLPRRPLAERPPRLSVLGKRLKLATLRGQGRATLRYQLQFNARGYYQLGPLILETGDLFGLHRRYRVATKPHFVLVYPRVVPITGYDIASRRPIGEVRITHRLFEDPTRISGIREYQPGDALNRIHWRATARTLTLQSKTYDPSTVIGATLLVDFHRASYPPRHEPNRSELVVTCAASLALAISLSGQQLGLVTNGRDTAERIRREGWEHDFRTRQAALASAAGQDDDGRTGPVIVPTRRGAERFSRILETLARLELADELTFTQLVHGTASRLPRDATVIAVLGTVSETTAASLAQLKRRGYAVTAFFVEYEQVQALDASRRFLAAGIEARRVSSEEMLAEMCGERIVW